MARDKRTKEQLEFDYAKHGWAFCNKQMLEEKLIRLSTLADRLSNSDKRKAELAHIRSKYNDM